MEEKGGKEEVDPLLNYLEEDKEVEKFKVNFDDDEDDDELICVEDLNQPEQMKKPNFDQKSGVQPGAIASPNSDKENQVEL